MTVLQSRLLERKIVPMVLTMIVMAPLIMVLSGQLNVLPVLVVMLKRVSLR